MEWILPVVTVGLVVTAVAAVWLYAQRQTLLAQRDSLTAERDRLAGELDDAERQVESLKAENQELGKQLAESNAKLDGLDDRVKSLLSDVSDKSVAKLVESLKQLHEGQQKQATAMLDQRKQAIEAMLKPIRESLDKHEKAVSQIEKEREGAYHALRQQLSSLVEDQKHLRSETQNLVKALRRPEVRGRWGEMQLRRVAELAGMIRHCDFYEQQSIASADGRLRPDMVVRLPGEGHIVIDAKTPIDAFIDAVECGDDETRAECLQRHVRNIMQQVRSLSSKDYLAQFDRSPDFVILFIPGESFLQAAVQHEPDIIERAIRSNVVIATPTTLITLLKTVAMGWREQRLADNAKRISQLGSEMHERIAIMVEHAQRVGKHLDNAVGSYNDFVGSLESRVLVSARRFRELGADSSKQLPAEGEVKQIESTPRAAPVVETDALS